MLGQEGVVGLEEAQLLVRGGGGGAKGLGVEGLPAFAETESAGEELEGCVDSAGDLALAALADEGARVVEAAVAGLANKALDLGGAKGNVTLQPLEEEGLDLVRKAEEDVARGAGTGVASCLKDVRNLVVVEAGDDGRCHDRRGDAEGAELADGVES